MAFKMKGFPQHKGVKLQSKKSKKKVDPDAPGTPGQPGYEPPVKREDLDKKGKAIWDAHRKKSPFEQKEDYDPVKSAGIFTDEDPDTQGPVKPVSKTGPATDRKKFEANERINDLEDKIEYLTNDIDELSEDQSREATAKKKEMIAKRKTYRDKLKILRRD
jgi:hypothetical protein